MSGDFLVGDGEDREFRAHPSVAVISELEGGLAVQDSVDVVKVPLTPEISAERQAAYVDRDPNTTYLLGCGDDRNATEESAEKLAQENTAEKDAVLRYYGGLYGLTRIFGVTMATQFGADSLKAYNGDLNKLALDVKNRVEATSDIKLVNHSAEANEGNAADLDMDSENGLGCAYCALIGGVCSLCAPGTDLSALARNEQVELFGDSSLAEPVEKGNAVFLDTFLDGSADSSLSREDFSAVGAPVSILSGAHAKAKDVVVVQNFHPGKVSSPKAANEAGVPFYNNDITAVAEALIKAFPELHLNPRIMFAAMDLDVRAVRHALAQHEDESLTAKDMKLERYGNPEEAVAYLESLAA
jgi:hypothetical protein